jgi:hypothetical protein
LLFRIIDSLVGHALPVWVIVATFIVPMHALITSSDLLTSLLTHGILIALFILILLHKGASKKLITKK